MDLSFCIHRYLYKDLWGRNLFHLNENINVLFIVYRFFSWISFQHWICLAFNFFSFCKKWTHNWKGYQTKFQICSTNQRMKAGRKNRRMSYYEHGMLNRSITMKTIRTSQWFVSLPSYPLHLPNLDRNFHTHFRITGGYLLDSSCIFN